MKIYSLTVTMLVGAAFTLHAGDCPNWSPKFDRITNPEVIEKLKQMTDWDAVCEQSGGAAKIIVIFKANIKTAKEHLETAQAAADQLAASEADKRRTVTWEECKNAKSAFMAAKCEVLNMQELILSLDGSIDLARCRLDQGK
jgi:hypothetical protein